MRSPRQPVEAFAASSSGSARRSRKRRVHSPSVSVYTRRWAAESVATSAHDLASVSEQISLSAGQMAHAMTEVSHGAEAQVQQLREVDDTLAEIRESADGVRHRSAEVNDLARAIETSAQEKRQEILRAIHVLFLAASCEPGEAGEGDHARDLRRCLGAGGRFVGI